MIDYFAVCHLLVLFTFWGGLTLGFGQWLRQDAHRILICRAIMLEICIFIRLGASGVLSIRISKSAFGKFLERVPNSR